MNGNSFGSENEEEEKVNKKKIKNPIGKVDIKQTL